jgi:hypothetical protein
VERTDPLCTPKIGKALEVGGLRGGNAASLKLDGRSAKLLSTGSIPDSTKIEVSFIASNGHPVMISSSMALSVLSEMEIDFGSLPVKIVSMRVPPFVKVYKQTLKC